MIASISSSLARLASLSVPVFFFFLMAQAAMAQGSAEENAAPVPALSKDHPSPVNGPGVKGRPQKKATPAVQSAVPMSNEPADVVAPMGVAPIDPGQATMPKGVRSSDRKEQPAPDQKN